MCMNVLGLNLIICPIVRGAYAQNQGHEFLICSATRNVCPDVNFKQHNEAIGVKMLVDQSRRVCHEVGD